MTKDKFAREMAQSMRMGYRSGHAWLERSSIYDRTPNAKPLSVGHSKGLVKIGNAVAPRMRTHNVKLRTDWK